ncbi:ATP-binding cassette domain-containing protein [Pseudoalteromonas denitrificans]|uniref:ABC transporter n=1 Tax=Pseudoalteromonas denitrificans DSM 6059 TaxID=1123010 RepID=A0A1I1GYI3_9GAMM|nr:ATP-binding cassette domain-containing protein [Pseudoalteromonas denitrificans]SFC16611.1 ABC transporter [Pseudoalteromonas denitrificans DSM 6059]
MLQIDCSIKLNQKIFKYKHHFELKNRCIGISGDSGCGKTTLLRIIAGLETNAQGNIKLNNEALQLSDENFIKPAFKRDIGFVFQDTRLFPHLTVLGNLKYALKRATTVKFSLEKVVEAFSLTPLLQRKPLMLSGGEKHRVAIARAILSSPQLLLMDEPLSGLDSAQKVELLKYLKYIKTQFDLSIIYVSHIEDELKTLSDEIIYLN